MYHSIWRSVQMPFSPVNTPLHLIFNPLGWPLKVLYTPANFFQVTWTWDFYPGSAKIFKEKLTIACDIERLSRMFRIFLKMFQTFPGPSSRIYLAKHYDVTITFPLKIGELRKCTIIYLDFSFLALVQVSVFFENVLVQAVIAHKSQLGTRNWS